jgi:hypothetical protein
MKNDESPAMQLIDHPIAGYYYLPGIAPYSCGVVSRQGFEIVYVTLQQPEPVREGFDRVASFLAEEGRPKAALCAISLRSPRPYSFQGFAEFNAGYGEILKSWDVFVNGINPIARTNVAPNIDPPSDPVLYGFAFTRPCLLNYGPTFVVAGAGELPEGILAREGVVALGDTSAEGLKAKAQFVMDLIENRLQCLEVNWSLVSNVNVYTAHCLTTPWPAIIARRTSALGMHGVCWHYSRPPIEEIEFEMDVRGTRTELRCG